MIHESRHYVHLYVIDAQIRADKERRTKYYFHVSLGGYDCSRQHNKHYIYNIICMAVTATVKVINITNSYYNHSNSSDSYYSDSFIKL